jgi:hypothetical protein
MKTNYWHSWQAFRRTEEYKRVYEVLKSKGIKQRYANNILRVAFDAGWGDKEIFNADNQKI